MALVGLPERCLARGEVICLKPGLIGLAMETLSESGHMDAEPPAVMFSEHAEGSPSLERLPHLQYPCAPESVFRTRAADAKWLRREILEWAQHIGATKLFWRVEPVDSASLPEGDWPKLRPFSAMAIVVVIRERG